MYFVASEVILRFANCIVIMHLKFRLSWMTGVVNAAGTDVEIKGKLLEMRPVVDRY
jgi:hypothetical protein